MINKTKTFSLLIVSLFAVIFMFNACKPELKPEPEPQENIINEYEWVDLGLPSGLKWAVCNVGAESPEDYGNYYAWGETTTKTEYTTENSVTYGLSISDLRSRGYIDGKGNLTSSHDAATVNWGDIWRMPTQYEMRELLYRCSWEWTTQNGINGHKVTGPNGNFIFLPATGYRLGSSFYNAGSNGYHWSSTSLDYNYYAYYLFYDGSDYVSYCNRYRGQTVRPVTE